MQEAEGQRPAPEGRVLQLPLCPDTSQHSKTTLFLLYGAEAKLPSEAALWLHRREDVMTLG